MKSRDSFPGQPRNLGLLATRRAERHVVDRNVGTDGFGSLDPNFTVPRAMKAVPRTTVGPCPVTFGG
jgi:hypothetical protein